MGVGQRGWVGESFEFRRALQSASLTRRSGGTLCWPSLARPPRLSLCSCLPLSCFHHMTYSPDTLEDPAVPRVYPTLHPGGGVYLLGGFSWSPSRSFPHPLPLFAPLQKYACSAFFLDPDLRTGVTVTCGTSLPLHPTPVR